MCACHSAHVFVFLCVCGRGGEFGHPSVLGYFATVSAGIHTQTLSHTHSHTHTVEHCARQAVH